MKILYGVLFLVGVCFVVIGILGHSAAWPAAALSFFAATMVAIRRKNQNDKEE